MHDFIRCLLRGWAQQKASLTQEGLCASSLTLTEAPCPILPPPGPSAGPPAPPVSHRSRPASSGLWWRLDWGEGEAGGLLSCWPLPALEVTGQAALAHASSQRLQLDAASEESSGWGRLHGPGQAGIRAVPTSREATRVRPLWCRHYGGQGQTTAIAPSVPDRGPPFFLEPGLLPATPPSPHPPQLPAAVPTRPVPCTETGPHFLSPLASSWGPCSLSGQGQWDAGFPGRCLEPPSCNSEMRPHVKYRKHRDPEPFPREEDPPGLALPDSRLL